MIDVTICYVQLRGLKWLKDGFLRLPIEMEQHQAAKDAAAMDSAQA